jgi:pimeloyl-ACP methyl ester carboxylesterase
MTLRTLPRSSTASGAAYFECGGGDECIVLVHGVGMRLEAWGPQLETLSSRYRVVAVDLPGHGYSRPLTRGAQLPDFVAWFRLFLEEAAIKTVSVAGHSMGALIAGGIVAEAPRRIKRVALLNGVYRRSASARAAVQARASEIGSGDFDRVAPLARWFTRDDVGGAAYRLVRDLLQGVDPVGYATAYGAFATGDAVYADRLSGVTCPALFLTGADDGNSTPEMSRKMAAAAANGKAVIIDGHRHMVNLTAPDDVNQALFAWLASD